MDDSEEEKSRRLANEVQPYSGPFGKGFAILDALSQYVRRGKGIGASEGTPKRVKSAPVLDLPIGVLQQMLPFLSSTAPILSSLSQYLQGQSMNVRDLS